MSSSDVNFRDEVPSIEIYSIDEAFMDLSSISNYSDITSKIKVKYQNLPEFLFHLEWLKLKLLQKLLTIAKKHTDSNVFIMHETEKF